MEWICRGHAQFFGHPACYFPITAIGAFIVFGGMQSVAVRLFTATQV
ncbi:MAG: hypothetical protein ACLQG3_11665 [Terracidiphilus sp.]